MDLPTVTSDIDCTLLPTKILYNQLTLVDANVACERILTYDPSLEIVSQTILSTEKGHLSHHHQWVLAAALLLRFRHFDGMTDFYFLLFM